MIPYLDLIILIFIILTCLILLCQIGIFWKVYDLEIFLWQKNDEFGKCPEKEDKKETKVARDKKILVDSETQTHDTELEDSRDIEVENEEIKHSHVFWVSPLFGDSVAGKSGKPGCKLAVVDSSSCEELNWEEVGIDDQELANCYDQETDKCTFEVANNDGYDECQPIQSDENSEESEEEGLDCNETSDSADCSVITYERAQENIVSKGRNGGIKSTATFPIPQRESENQGGTDVGPKTQSSAWSTGISQKCFQDNTENEIEVSGSTDSGIYTDTFYPICRCTSTEEVLQSNLEENRDRDTDAVTVAQPSSNKDAFDENSKLHEENDQGYKPVVSNEDTECVSDTDVPLDESKVKRSDLEAIDASTDTNKCTESIVRDLPEPNCEREHSLTIGASHADMVVRITPRKDECNDSLSVSLRSQVVLHDNGSASMVSPKVNSSTEFNYQIGPENRFICKDEGYSSLSSLESSASDFGDSMRSLGCAMSSLEFVPEAEIELPEEAESETDSPKTRKTVETGHAQITVPWWRFIVDIRRILIDSRKEIFVFQIGLDNRVNTDCAGLWTESFECVVKHKGDRIFPCPFCFIFVRFIPSKQFTTKIGQMLQAYSFVDSDLAISYETAAFEMGRPGNRCKLEPTKDEDLTHMVKYLFGIDEMTEKDNTKPGFTASPLKFVDRRPKKQFSVEVIEKTICTGELHFDPTRCNFECFSATVRPRPELDDNEKMNNVHNYFHWRSVSSNYGKKEPYLHQSQETRVITQEVLSNQMIQTKRVVEPKKSKNDRGKQSTEAKRSNDQLNGRIRNGEDFEKELGIGSSTEDGVINLSNTPVSDHDDQNSVRSTSVQSLLDDSSIPPSEKSKTYPADRTKFYHRWLEKVNKSKVKTTGRKQHTSILQHSNLFREKIISFTISKRKKFRPVAETDRNYLRSSLKRQALRTSYHLTNYVKPQVKNRFPKYWLSSGKLDTHVCRIQAKRRQMYLRDVMPKQMRLYLAGSRLCRVRKSKGAYDLKSKMKARASCTCCRRRCKKVDTKESQIQTKRIETKTAQAITKPYRCKIVDGQLRSENVCFFNPQIQMFKKNIGLQNANVSADKKGEHLQKEKHPNGETDFGDIDERKCRGKSSNDICSRFSQEDIENILFAKLSKLQSDDFKSLFRTIGAKYSFSTENGFVCLLRNFDCWTNEEAMKNILKRLVLEKIGPIEISPGFYISEEEDIDVEFTK